MEGFNEFCLFMCLKLFSIASNSLGYIFIIFQAEIYEKQNKILEREFPVQSPRSTSDATHSHKP